MSDVEATAKAIEDLINAADYVSFAELDREVPGFAPGEQDSVLISLGASPIWFMSQAGSEAMQLLFDQRRVCVTPSSMMTYLIDGKALTIAKWMPMTLRPGSFANFITPSGMPLHAPKEGVAKVRRWIARDKKAGRPHGTEIRRPAP